MTNRKMNDDGLAVLGFRPVGKWCIQSGRLDYVKLDIPNFTDSEWSSLIKAPNALYAFVCNKEVFYIGKTTQSIQKRFVGYKNPGNGQQTNKKCHDNILAILSKVRAGNDNDNTNAEVYIFLFHGPSQFQWAGYEINLPAGLEDILIRTFNPAWNGGQLGQKVSESAENENAAQNSAMASPQDSVSGSIANSITSNSNASSGSLPSFTVKLGTASYDYGFINPGIKVDKHIGGHGIAALIYLGNMNDCVQTKINRTANLNGTARILGRADVSRWFQRNFKMNGLVNAVVLSPTEILLNLPVCPENTSAVGNPSEEQTNEN
jgi:hypothetical protein